MKTKSIFEENLNKNLENIKKSLRTQFRMLLSRFYHVMPRKKASHEISLSRDVSTLPTELH